jgi:hypothetical protein
LHLKLRTKSKLRDTSWCKTNNSEDL